MANRTPKDARSVKGTNPQYLVEKIIRMRIYDSKFWKEECFALSAELMVDKGMELRFVGGVYGGNIKPTPFLCLLLKMLQIQPEKDIVIEFIRQEDFKYLRALGAVYMRLTGGSIEIFKYLEPLFNDYRKLRWMNREGRFELMHMDEFIDLLLTKDSICDITLPRLQKRQVLEETNEIVPYVSALDEDLDELSASSSDEEEKKKEKEKAKERKVRRPSPDPAQRHSTRADNEKGQPYGSLAGDRRRSPPGRGDREQQQRGSERRRSRSPTGRRGSDRGDRDRDVRDKDRRRGGGGERDRGDRDRRDEKSGRSDRDRGGSGRDRDRDRDGGSGKDKDDRKRRGGSWEREVLETNEMRAKIGLAPLQS